MKYPSIRYVFDRKHESSKHNKGLVQIEVTSEGKRKWIGTGVRLYIDQWDKRRMVVNSPDMVSLNQSLEEQRQRIQDWVFDLQRRKEVFDFAKLTRFLSECPTSDSFIEYVAKRVRERADIRDSTKRAQIKLVKSLQEFGKITYFSDLTLANITKYDSWLHGKGYRQTTIHSYHKFMKIYINDAIRAEIVERNPYLGFKVDRGKSKIRKYLTDDEVKMIINAELPTKGLDRVRDLFIFQCYTGFAYAELVNFDFSKVVQRGDKYVLHETRMKTDELFYVVLMTPAVEILKKYNFKLPIISNAQYNLQLKAVATFAGLEKNITSHMGRHTFAVFALNHGAKIENVAKMMGHTDIKTTQIYAKVLDTEVEREFERLEQTLSF